MWNFPAIQYTKKHRVKSFVASIIKLVLYNTRPELKIIVGH